MANFKNIGEKTILGLLNSEEADFLIPAYQRQYAWGIDECENLWNDLFAFAKMDEAIPEEENALKSDEKYFLGPIVVFENKDKKLEVIDGQQRLTSIMLLLRAFYAEFEDEKSDYADLLNTIAGCIWKKDDYFRLDRKEVKIDSEVVTDDDKDDLYDILTEGKPRARTEEKKKSRYVENYEFFIRMIGGPDGLKQKYTARCQRLPICILRGCELLYIQADTQESAFQIFSTLNDRGMPLSDSDIFKAQLYGYYKDYPGGSKTSEFVERWKNLEELCEDFSLNEIFARYMYYVRAKDGEKSTTVIALRKFYEEGNYKLLRSDDNFSDIECLAQFWKDVSTQNEDKLSVDALKNLFVLNYAPNSMWIYFVSVYFLTYAKRDKQDIESWSLEDEPFKDFLDKTISFFLQFSMIHPGVSALRAPLFTEMINIVNNQPVTFTGFLVSRDQLDNRIDDILRNPKALTRFILALWTMKYKGQSCINIDVRLEIEHIYAVKRNEMEQLSSPEKIESIGNKSLLEKQINIRAADYEFEYKKKYYRGEAGRYRKKTDVKELIDLSDNLNDFDETNIDKRTADMKVFLMKYLDDNGMFEP